jgi:tRNA nucleotidyltransferase (CCA-adding enzyme)
VTGAGCRELWRRLAPQTWPVDPGEMPPETALVGGAVRDALLDRLGPRPDLDLVVPGDAIGLCRQWSARHGGTAVILDRERDMARLVIAGWTIDLARCQGSELAEDLAMRDYSINAMALPVDHPDGPVQDPMGGLGDLQAGRLRALSERNLLADPLRLLRGVRLCGELGFTPEPGTWRWIRRRATHLADAAPERILSELLRLVAADVPAPALALLRRSGLVAPWQAAAATVEGPDPDSESARRHGLDEAERRTALPLARLAGLVHGPGLEALRASRRLQQRCERLRRWWRRLALPGTAEGVRGQLEALGEAGRLQLHRELEEDLPAWLLRAPAALSRAWLPRWRDRGDPLFHPAPPLDGFTLQQELGIPPSRLLGQLLEGLTRDRAFARVRTRQEALEAARRRWRHLAGGGNPHGGADQRCG